MSTDPYLSVKALTKYIKKKFDADPHLRDVYVKGELSNVKIHTSGHIYFTLKDNATRLPGVMFSASAKSVKFKPESGMTVLIRGDVSVYEASGQYQLYAQSMQVDGIGDYYLAFEQLKEKLAKEGLFDALHKKQLPRFPKRIAVVTAQTGAAVRDIIITLHRRYPLAEVVLYPTLVQGAGAVQSIVQSIQAANTSNYDVLIVGRGGGSIEDLWAFNEEAVARVIVASKIPIISAIGHETDTTIADFVSDLRAPTPTAAAELAVPSQAELLEKISSYRSRMYRTVSITISQQQKMLERLTSSFPLAYPERLYRPFIERIERATDSLQRESLQYVSRSKEQYRTFDHRLKSRMPLQQIRQSETDVTELGRRLDYQVNQLLKDRQQQLSSSIRTLDALSPLKIMDRGYSIPYIEGAVVKSVTQVKKGDSLTIAMQDGMIQATVNEINPASKGDVNDG
ncbi:MULTISPECIES: exodeoxyribonuclease VII large subunit [Planococcus]|uniref:Exodeoxyribonuclease 7 large subunit n=1 Tax=Planococcus faecalis TaxID=1598147 RepID=A0ABN4XMQ2_9BACL|nr:MULTISPECIES: exodeoxyribonuclease VII large subunit [Planococcus]AQU79202.1 exodeoxyribonuclease VII large subunit [Planococcus faecalis]MDJ0332309.1 exodeoxyribonuclease VII large subunit [Planococcus sp. S3-L1]